MGAKMVEEAIDVAEGWEPTIENGATTRTGVKITIERMGDMWTWQIQKGWPEFTEAGWTYTLLEALEAVRRRVAEPVLLH